MATAEFAIINLTYEESVREQRYGFNRGYHPRCAAVPEVADWIAPIISYERQELATNPYVEFDEWRFWTSITDYFTMNGHRFDNIIIFLGKKKMYWRFSQHHDDRTIGGCCRIQQRLCRCCIQYHYLNILKSVKDAIRNTRG